MKSRNLLLASASALAIVTAFAQNAYADDCKTSGVITGTCTSTVILSGNLSIASTGGFTGISSNTYRVTNSGSISSLINAGIIQGISSITGAGIGVYNTTLSTIGTFTNTNSIVGDYAAINNTGNIGLLSNTGLIKSNANYSAAINNYGTISTISNLGGTVSAPSDTGSGTGIWLDRYGVVNSLNNTGLITGRYGLNNNGYIGTVTNSGVITAQSTALFNNASTYFAGTVSTSVSGTMGTLVNSGTISSTSGYGFANYGNGSLASLTNSGTISAGTLQAIYNVGQIDSLSNSGSLGGNALGSSFAPAAGIYNLGHIGTLTNTGTINGIYSIDTWSIGTTGSITSVNFSAIDVLNNQRVIAGTVYNQGILGTLNNSGTIGGGAYGIYNSPSSNAGSFLGASTISTLINSGTITGTNYGIANYNGIIKTIANSGVINSVYNNWIIGDTDVAINNSGSIGTIFNTGRITVSAGTAIANAASGTLGTLTNTGTISGSKYALYNSGSLGVITNSGTISGSIYSTNALVLAGGSGIGTIGALTGGTITAPTVSLVSGNLLLADNVVGTVANVGATVSMTSPVTITGNYGQSSGTLVLGASGALTVSGVASISGGVISLPTLVSSMGNYLTGAPTVLIDATSATVTGGTFSTSGLAGLSVGLQASGGDVVYAYLNDYIGSTIGTVINTGTINATYGVYVASTGSLGTLTNSGVIVGLTAGVANYGSISNLVNAVSGTISGSSTIFGAPNGIMNYGSIDALANSGLINTVYNWGPLGTLTNTGTISGGIINNESWTTVQGSIKLTNAGTITSVDNQGFTGSIFNGGVIKTISNSGTLGALNGSSYGISNLMVSSGSIPGGIIESLVNTGTILGSLAGISNSGWIKAISNSGSISSLNNYSIVGDTLGISNSGVVGSINNAGTFSGNRALYNTGSISTLANTGTINGGTVGILNGGIINTIINSKLITSGGAAIYNYRLISRLTNTGTISTAGDSAEGVFNMATISQLTNAGTITAVGDSASAIANVGTILSLANSGTISGSGYAIYNDGSIGQINNAGLISGNVYSSSDLVVSGASAVGVWGSFSGGTIAAPTVSFVSGNLLLGDNIAGNVAATGGTIAAATAIVVSGNYTQSAGVLNLASTGSLSVTGNASIGGGTISIASGLSSAANYLAGDSVLLIDASSATVTGGTVVGSLNGLSAVLAAKNGDVVYSYLNDYIGGTLGSIANAGDLNANYGVYVASTGNLGTLTNSGKISSSIYSVYNEGFISTITNDGAILGSAVVNGSSTITHQGVYTSGTVGSFTNNGTVSGIFNNYQFVNGTIVQGTIGTLVNTGTIAASVASGNSGVIGTIINTGVFGQIGSAYGFSNGASWVQTYTNGTVVSRTWAFGVVDTLRNDGAFYGVSNAGTINNVINTGNLVTGIATYPALNNYGAISTITNTGTIAALVNGFGTWTSNGTLLRSQGGTIGSLDNSGTILGRFSNSGIIGTITNSGLISGITAGIASTVVASTVVGTLTPSITAIINTGTIAATSNTLAIGVRNEGWLGTLSTAGLITATDTGTVSGSDLGVRYGAYGVANFAGGTIGQLTNAGTITVASANLTSYGEAAGIYNSGIIGALQNDGVIDALLPASNSGPFWSYGIDSQGQTGRIINNGTITAAVGIEAANNYGTAIKFDEITNNGVINGYWGGIEGGGIIGAVNNNGTILVSSDSAWGINVGGTIGALTNSGKIILRANYDSYDAYAVVANGMTGTLINSGLIDIQANGPTEGYATGIGAYGTVGVLRNDGAIVLNVTQFGDGIEVENASSLINTGTISINAGIGQGVYTEHGTVGALSSSGTIAVTGGLFAAGIYNGSNITYNGVAATHSIASLSISGAVIANATGALKLSDMPSWYSGDGYAVGAYGIANGAASTIGSLVNEGVIAATAANGVAYGLFNSGTVGDIVNSGTISAVDAICSSGSLGTITNSGVISGNITSASDLVIAGGTAKPGILTGGTIKATGVSFTGGSLSLADNIVAGGGSGTVANTGATLNLNSVVSITGNYTQTSGVLQLIGSGELLVSGTAKLSGGTVALSSTANYLAGTTVTLVGASSGSSYNGVTVTLTGVNATADTTSTKDLVITVANNYVGGTIGTVGNSGTINSQVGMVIASTGTVESASNTGTIIGTSVVVSNAGSIGTFTNQGSMSGDSVGIQNSGSIGTVGNSGMIALLDGQYGFNNTGTVGTIDNSGTFTGSQYDIFNQGTVGSLINSGHIGSTYAVYIDTTGNLGQFTNSGEISGTIAALYNAGQIGSVTNSGTISGGSYGLFNSGTLGGVTNSGTISGTGYAIYNSGSLGQIANSGVINGNVTSTNSLTFVGATGGYGTLSGGTITAPTVFFTSGTLALNDAIVGDASNSGAVLSLGSAVAMNGNYTQSAGVLDLTGIATLTVTGTANLSGGTILSALASTGNYLAGQNNVLIDAANGSSYSGAKVTLSAPTSASYSIGNSNGDLVVTYQNDYVGGALASLSNSGTISGSSYGVYVASTGSLGSLANSGTLSGSAYAIYSAGSLGAIANTGLISGNISSTRGLSFAGGAGSAGILSGGTITAPTVAFTGGTLTLGDAIVGNASNSGAVLKLATGAGISGNYAQSAGTLDLSSFGILTVTGTASITGGTVVAGLSSTGNYLFGGSQVLIDGAVGSSYVGENISISGVTGLAVSPTSSNGDLIINYQNDYVGGALASLSNSGTISGSSYGVYVASMGSLGSLANSGTLSGSAYAIYSAGSLGAIANTGLISGNISSTKGLSFAGGAGSAGTLSGGTITAPTVAFTGGTLTLGDAIVGNASNSGAVLKLAAGAGISGNYAQSAGTLDLSSFGILTVTGTASITGGTVVAGLSSTGNYLVGASQVLIDGAAGSSYAGETISLSGVAGLAVSPTSSNGDLIINYQNDYVGGSLATLSNASTLGSGSAYGVYVASSGAVSALVNSGTLTGSNYALYALGNVAQITNTGLISGNLYAANGLTIGSSGTGVFSGGTITAKSVSFASGLIKLSDAINVGASGVVSVTGATIELPTTVSITGNYSQTSGVLVSDVISTANYGALAVSGGATVNSTAITISGSSIKAGDTYTIVDANSASSYTGDTVTVIASRRFRALLSTVNNDLIATIRPLFSEIGLAKGGDAVTMGSVLENLTSVSAMQPTVDALSNLSDADMGGAILQEAPAQVGNSAAVLQRAMLTSGLIGSAIDAHSAGSGITSGWTVWSAALGGLAHRSADGGTQAYDTTVFGLVAGVDGLALDNLRVGAAVSWSRGWNGGTGEVADNSNGVTSYSLTGYAAWSENGWFVNGHAGIGYDNYQQRRVLGYLSETARGSFDGYQYTVAANGGYDFETRGATFTPTWSIAWLRADVDGYTETGAGTDNLSIGGYKADQVEGAIGFKISSVLKTDLGNLLPELHGSWVHDFVIGLPWTNASLGGTNFQLASDQIAPDGAKFGVGLKLLQESGFSLRLGYDGEFRRDYIAHTGNAQAQFTF